MWILKSNRENDPLYYLLCGKEHSVGRRDTDLILERDQSVSRRHAVIQVMFEEADVGKPGILPRLTIRDLNSKYGTYMNAHIELSVKLPENEAQSLQDGDRIRFGLQWNEWKLARQPILVSTSTLPPSEKKELKSLLHKLGGHLVADWQENCTHLTMNSLTLTVKVVCALAAGKPIVTPAFWKKYLEAASVRTALPDCEDFIPDLAESALNRNEVSFKINEKRRSLFSGKTFVFATPMQHSKQSCMIVAAGGKAVTLEECGMSKEELCGSDVVMMQHSTDRRTQLTQVPDFYEDFVKHIKQNGRRVIPESDIGLAVLHCSTEKHCNPEFDVLGTVLPRRTVLTPPTQSMQVLAVDSQASTTNQSRQSAANKPTETEPKVIPESGRSTKSKGTQERRSDGSETLQPAGTSQINTIPIPLESDMKEEPSSQNSIFMSRDTTKRPREEEEAAANDRAAKKFAGNNTMTVQSENWSVPAIKQEIEPNSVKEEPPDEDADIFCTNRLSSRRRIPPSADLFEFTDTLALTAGKEIKSSNSTAEKKRKLSSLEEPVVEEPPAKRSNTNTSGDTQRKGRDGENDLKDFLSVDTETVQTGDVADAEDGVNKSFKALEVIMKDLKDMLRPERYVPRNREESADSSKVVNYKKFRKVAPCNLRILPQIIGGRDLFLHEESIRDTHKYDQMSDHDEEREKDAAQQEDHDMWSFEPVSRAHKKR